MFEDKKSIRKPIKNIYIPEKDENISTREVKKVTSTMTDIQLECLKNVIVLWSA